MDSKFNNLLFSGLAPSPEYHQDKLLFAATDRGLMMTKDSGATWEIALAPLDALESFAVSAVLTTRGNNGQPLVIAGVSGGVLRSEDSGQTWQFVLFKSPQPLVSALAASVNHVLYAGTAQDGIFHSKDNGKSWARWNFGLLDWHIFSVTTANWSDGSEVVYAGAETGVFYSNNQGRTWRESDFPIDAGAVFALSASSGPVGDLVIAGTEGGRLYRSIDRGIHWERCTDEVFDGEINAIVSSGMFALAICKGKLFHSHNGGMQWMEINLKPPLRGSVLALTALHGPASNLLVFAGLADGSIQLMDRIPLPKG